MARTRQQSQRLKKRFLEHFAQYGNVTLAAKHTGIDRVTPYKWQEHDEAFAAAYRQADIQATEVLEAEARRRAVEGTTQETPIYYRGDLQDTIIKTEYSDTLLIFLLKARAPEKYRDRYDVTTGGEPIHLARSTLEADIQREAEKVLAERARKAAVDSVDSGQAESEDS